MEIQRPRLHFTPPFGWMNDPNGLVWFEGEYHVFYQYHPHSLLWGPMHWGHAVSRDLLTWEHLPIALAPDELGAIFSGCVVVDSANTSGLFPDGPGLVALFTHAGQRQQQSLAYSSDKGRTWTKSARNPVIANPPNGPLPHDFRDPSVHWNQAFQTWIMVLAAKDHMELWTSDNLLSWSKESEFLAPPHDSSAVWECPCLVPVVRDGTSQARWVLLASVNPGGPNQGGSATQYFVGDLVRDGGLTFRPEPGEERWLDYGQDNYAAIAWSNAAEPLYLGWMNNWRYAVRTPATTWRGAMTTVRRLSLKSVGGRDVAVSRLHPVYDAWAAPRALPTAVAGWHLVGPALSTCRVDIAFGPGGMTDQRVEFRTDFGDLLCVGREGSQGMWYVDRSGVGGAEATEFGGRQEAPLAEHHAALSATLILDTNSVEVFFHDGECVITDLLFPRGPWSALRTVGAPALTLQVTPLRAPNPS